MNPLLLLSSDLRFPMLSIKKTGRLLDIPALPYPCLPMQTSSLYAVTATSLRLFVLATTAS